MLATSGWNRLGQNRAVGGEDKWPVKDTASKRDSVTVLAKPDPIRIDRCGSVSPASPTRQMPGHYPLLVG